MTLIACSQSGYPRVVVIGNDTVIAITRTQQREILKTYNYVEFLKNEIEILRASDSADVTRINELVDVVAQYELVIANYESLKNAQGNAVDALMKQLKLWKRKNTITNVKLIAVSVTTPVFAVGGFLIGFLVKH